MSTAASPLVVSSGTPAAAPAATPAAATAPTAAEVAALKAELETSKQQAAEHERTAQFWYNKSNAKPAPAEKPAAAAEEEDDDVLDLITSKGAEGLEALLKKRGFVSAAEVDEKVNAKASQITGEAKLIDDYPELAKHDSEFFKATALNYGELKKQGVPEAVAMRMAAERAELAGIRAGKIKTPTQKSDEEKAARASERAARAAAGAGDHGGRDRGRERGG